MSSPEFEDQTTTVALPLLLIPQTFAGGRYRVKQLLGEGGQKYVLLARDASLDRDVVISFLKPGGGDASSNSRLLREAGALGRLGDHPNIVTIYDIGDEGGRPYIVCQYVQGGTVAGLLNGCEGRRLTLQEAIQIALQVCHALAHSHRAGIVHRDLKPSNIWLTHEGAVKLGDFGLALRMGSAQSLQGTLVGTPAYISPEQGEGRPAGPASDLYALGIVLYEMLTGRPPFVGDHLVGIIWQHINTQPVAPSWHNPEIPIQVESLILRLLAKSPAERPPGAAEVAETLAAISGSKPAMAERVVRRDTSLSRIAPGIFVGREPELQQLQSALQETSTGQGSLRMLVGEPGSGKTRITEQLATYARLHGFEVLQGRCYEGEGAPAFWPWVQTIRSYLETCNPAELFADKSGAAAIAEIVPEIRGRMEVLEAPPPLEPAQARFRLFESVTTFLKNASRAKPLLLILDDLHWADAPSLLLLVFLAREFRSARMLVVGTFRDIGLARHHPLARALGDLAQQGAADRIQLGGLSEADVARFMETSTGTTPSPSLVKAVYAQTEGNPFFVSETIKLLISEGKLRGKGETGTSAVLVPQSVREVIGRRLDRLSEDCNKALTTASVLGSEFSMSVLQRVSDLPADRLLDVLDEAVAARVINESPQAAGQFTFSHALIREVLYEGLGVNLRVRLHRRAGAVLEEVYAFELDDHIDQLANHFLQGATGGDVDKAIEYAIRAGGRASSRTAYEEAVAHYERALKAIEAHPRGNEGRRGELLLALGDALKKAGEVSKANEILERAADCARRAGQWESLARVALIRTAAVTGAIGVMDEAQLRLLNEALDKLPPQDSAIRASLLAQLSAALYYAPDRRVPLSLEAVEMARRVGDPTALITALYCRHMALTLTDDLEDRRQAALEMLHIAEGVGSKETMLRAWYRLIVDAMEMGDMRALDEAIESYARLADELRQPAYLWLVPFFRGNKAVLQGRFEECERLAREVWGIANRVEDRAALVFLASQTALLRVEQGRAEEQLQPVESYIQKYPMVPGYRATLSYVYAHVGRLEDARRELERVTANDLASLPRDGSWIVVLASLSWVCWSVGHAQLASVIYPLLLPYATRNIVAGNAGVGCGSVWRGLGLLSASMSRWEEAAHHLEEAVRMNGRMGARPMEAGSKYELAEVLLARGAPGDRERAMRLFDEALAAATEIGAAGLEKRIHLARVRE
jgi:eukaryotic-like serine/threonine-protein kinase